ncbi:homeobox protein Nkx-2.2 isoform 3 [Mus musculus]|nr:homeobox protein Nkx-2.2 isoform 3 [Mus musculus]
MDARIEAAVPIVSARWSDWIRKQFQVGRLTQAWEHNLVICGFEGCLGKVHLQ